MSSNFHRVGGISKEDGDENFNNIYLSTDLLSVLSWLSDYDKFERKFEIEWRNVPTHLKPADFKKWSFYNNTPPFLLLPPSDWPSRKKDEMMPLQLLAADATRKESEIDVTTDKPRKKVRINTLKSCNHDRLLGVPRIGSQWRTILITDSQLTARVIKDKKI